jgi:hypothetical protein
MMVRRRKKIKQIFSKDKKIVTNRLEVQQIRGFVHNKDYELKTTELP